MGVVTVLLMRSLMTVIREDREGGGGGEVVRFLSWPGDMELDRAEHVEQVHLESGAALEGFAGDGAGGTYFFCGEGGEERPVLYADSEGGAGLIAVGLPELIRLLLVAPWWRSCREFTERESEELAVEYLRDIPDLEARRDRVAAALGLALPSAGDALARLWEVATGVGADFTLVYTPEGVPYEPLIKE